MREVPGSIPGQTPYFVYLFFLALFFFVKNPTIFPLLSKLGQLFTLLTIGSLLSGAALAHEFFVELGIYRLARGTLFMTNDSRHKRTHIS
ncbi:hypothetical protein BJ170DRAFT_302888 [Xylariales sp. AK1849]|nr:hypothetical protein BJ170DRAFT_302888 [Xylariales sp. AK1849]